MTTHIQRAAVLGSGVMGSGIAAHLANLGINVLLLDLPAKELTDEEKAKGLTLDHPQVRNRQAVTSKQKLFKQKPAPLASKENAQRIEVGNLEDDLHKLGEVDWIIEVVVENLDVKKQLFEKVEKHTKPGTIVSSNTSGISVNAMVEGRSDSFKKTLFRNAFFSTHQDTYIYLKSYRRKIRILMYWHL